MEMPWEFVATALGGGGLGAIIKWLTDKGKDRAYVMGAVDKATEAAFKRWSAEVTYLTEQVGLLRKHSQECEDELAESRRDRQELRDQINALMRGRVASWGEHAPGSGI
jgi:hypothetical protein